MRQCACLCVALMLSGCAAVGRIVPEALRPSPSTAAEPQAGSELMAYLGRLRGLNERGLAAEAARQKVAARNEPSDLAQVKVALALSLSAQAEESEIILLVEPLVKKEGAEEELRAVASFLHVQVTERRKLKESAAAAGIKLRDERRAAEVQKQRADALQERAAQLQQKIDALTELEKSLAERQAQGR